LGREAHALGRDGEHELEDRMMLRRSIPDQREGGLAETAGSAQRQFMRAPSRKDPGS